MDYSLGITIAGSIASLVGMAVSLHQARSAQKSSSEARAAMTTVQLAAVVERLKTAQNHIRAIAPDRADRRGVKPSLVVDELRQEFDSALSSLPAAGPASGARKTLGDAQKVLTRITHHSRMKPIKKNGRNCRDTCKMQCQTFQQKLLT